MESLIFLALIFVAMYLLLIRPQQQRVKAQRELMQSLQVGDEVVTIGGLFGRISRLDDESAWIEAADGVELRYRRAAISGRTSPSPLGEATGEDVDEGEGGDFR